ncbi:hypothetical protein V8C42DRAFT_261082 [Trichoderma barbatum]
MWSSSVREHEWYSSLWRGRCSPLGKASLSTSRGAKGTKGEAYLGRWRTTPLRLSKGPLGGLLTRSWIGKGPPTKSDGHHTRMLADTQAPCRMARHQERLWAFSGHGRAGPHQAGGHILSGLKAYHRARGISGCMGGDNRHMGSEQRDLLERACLAHLSQAGHHFAGVSLHGLALVWAGDAQQSCTDPCLAKTGLNSPDSIKAIQSKVGLAPVALVQKIGRHHLCQAHPHCKGSLQNRDHF